MVVLLLFPEVLPDFEEPVLFPAFPLTPVPLPVVPVSLPLPLPAGTEPEPLPVTASPLAPDPAPVPDFPLKPVPLPVVPVSVPSPMPVPPPVADWFIVLSEVPIPDPLSALIVPPLLVEVLSVIVVLLSSAPLPPHDSKTVDKRSAKNAFFMALILLLI